MSIVRTRSGPLMLVVDDEKEQRILFQRVFVSLGYRVIFAANGEDGFRAACAERPALVLLDVNMPGMDGIGCCRLSKTVFEVWGVCD
jgi:CheY-like chemotaxis protein